MRGEYFSYGLLTALAIALLIAAFTDIRTRKIDNRLNLAVALGAPLFWWATGLSLWPGVPLQFGVAVACFAFCCVFFALNWMGGGDVKLLTALALWFQPLDFLSMFMLIAIIGAVLTIAFGAWHIARRQKERVAIPYGIAIGAAEGGAGAATSGVTACWSADDGGGVVNRSRARVSASPSCSSACFLRRSTR
jgi:prepilin peptidase CpaA